MIKYHLSLKFELKWFDKENNNKNNILFVLTTIIIFLIKVNMTLTINDRYVLLYT